MATKTLTVTKKVWVSTIGGESIPVKSKMGLVEMVGWWWNLLNSENFELLYDNAGISEFGWWEGKKRDEGGEEEGDGDERESGGGGGGAAAAMKWLSFGLRF